MSTSGPDDAQHVKEPVARKLHVDDLLAAEQFARTKGHAIRYDHTYQAWRVWDGHRWKVDDTGLAVEWCKQMIYDMRDLALLIPDQEERMEKVKAIQRAHSINKVKSIMQSASTLRPLASVYDDFDRNPYLINLGNGIYDLKTNTLSDHDPSMNITLFAGTDYDPNATCPYWDNVIDRAFDNPEVNLYFHAVLGYAFSGLDIEKYFWLLWGKSDTGKTTIMGAIRNVMGEYFRNADWSSFALSGRENEPRHRTDLVALVGGRLISASEGDAGVRLSEGMIKRITGRTPLQLRDLNSKPFVVTPAWKIILDTNHLPPLRAADDAIWRRVIVIEFRNPIPRAEQEEFKRKHGDLREILDSERSGILNRILDGWKYYQKGGLEPPDVVRNVTLAYRKREDTFGEFLTDLCVQDDSARIEKRVLHERYVQWAKQRSEYEMSAKKFGELMNERGFEEVRSKSTRYWIGIALRVDESALSLPVPLEKDPF